MHGHDFTECNGEEFTKLTLKSLSKEQYICKRNPSGSDAGFYSAAQVGGARSERMHSARMQCRAVGGARNQPV